MVPAPNRVRGPYATLREIDRSRDVICDTFRTFTLTVQGDFMGSKRRPAWKSQYNNGPTAEQLRAGFSDRDLHCRSLKDMSEHEIRAIEQTYGARVVRPITGRKKRRPPRRPPPE